VLCAFAFAFRDTTQYFCGYTQVEENVKIKWGQGSEPPNLLSGDASVAFTAYMCELGKAFEDKRGQSITSSIVNKSWLYLNGRSVVCSRHMELAAMVSSINPSLTSTSDSVVLSTLQQVSELIIPSSLV